LVLTFLGNLVWYYWDLFRLFYGYPMDKNHHVIRGSEVRNRAIFLWLFFTTGVSGLHHFYLRNTVRGIIEFSLFYLSLLFFGIGLLAVKVKMILFLIGILFFLVLYGFLIFDLVQFLIYKMPMNGGKKVEGRDLTWSADNPRSFNTALLLNLWGGLWGLDRYYLGYKVLALLKFFTVGGLLLWNILDSILIYTGSIKDVEGKPLR
ncbi:MAG: NINE protein, partial [Candidatus Hydrogenedentota bacterium]